MSDDERSGLENEAGGMNRGSLLKRLALGSAALSIPSLAAVEAAIAAPSAATATVFPKHPKWKFAFINHVTTNPFFVPTQYGAADAAKMVDASYTWTGSTKADVGEMINAFNAAISAKADGIAVCVVDKGAFEAPIKRALSRGIAVVVVQRRRRPGRGQGTDGLHRPGPVRVGLRDGQADRRARPERRRRAVHRHAGRPQHPAADRRRARGDQAVGQARQGDGRRRRARTSRRSCR